MGLFSFGSNDASGQQASFGGSIGFGGSQSTNLGLSGGASFGQNFGQSFVDQSQQPFLNFLRNQAVGDFQRQQGFANALTKRFEGLGQASAGQSRDVNELSADAAGTGAQFGAASSLGINNQFLSQLGQQAGGNQALVAAQTGQLSDVLAQQFAEQINPAISREAQGFGQLGGGRQGVAQGAAIQGQQRALAAGNVGFQQADAQRAQQAALGGGQLFGQGVGQMLQGLQGQQASLGQQFGALDQQGQFLNQQGQFAQQGFGAQFQPGQQLQQLFGAPTVLNQQGGFDQSQQFGFNTGQSSQFDFDQAFNQGFSNDQSSGRKFSIL